MTTQEEKDLREKISKEISANLLAVLENCACLGSDALNPGPTPITSTYVKRMQHVILKNIEG
jgi:hypothetical protein